MEVVASTKIRVVKLDAKKLKLLIQGLGKRMLVDTESDDRTHAWQMMGALHDLRVLPWYIKALDSGRANFISSTVQSLAEFDDAKAVAGIQRVMHFRGADLVNDEHATAELAESLSLATSKHENAWPLLLGMSDDRYYAVRLTVLHQLNKRRPPDVKTRMQGMLKDSHQDVRKEAQRYLEGL